jgi:hypothetical protein
MRLSDNEEGAFMKRQQLLLVTSILCILTFAFQNCSVSQPVKFSEKEPSFAAAHETEGNGQGYDGKVYILTGDVCPDSSNLQAKILLQSRTMAHLVRENCQDITPKLLGSSEFQLVSNNVDQLIYLNRTFRTQVPFGGTTLDMTNVNVSSGFRYEKYFSFGTPADALGTTATQTQSKLQLYEDGIALGPAHSVHSDIATIGLGKFSHWIDTTGEFIYFSASDNSNPTRNGRIYSYKISN